MKKLTIIFLTILTVGCIKTTNIKITEMKAKADEKNYSYDYTVPQLTFKKQEMIKENLMFKSLIEEGKERLENEANDMAEFEKNSGLSTKYEEKISFTEKKNNFGITSIVLDIYSYFGGAHGISDSASYNYNDKTGKRIELKDILSKEGEKYIKDKILNAIEEDTKKSDEDETKVFYYEDPMVELNDVSVYFEEDSLTIGFSPYTLAPYSSGSPSFKFSKEELSKYLIFKKN